MADTLAQEVRANYSKKRVIIALLVVVVLLLLLWWRKPSSVTNNNTTYKLGDLLSSPNYINYDLPGLDIPDLNHTGIWDWMQTTDCACDCSAPKFEPTTPAAIMLTQYAYIGAPALSPAPTVVFPAFIGPPLPTWWYEPGYNVHHEQARYVMTSDGVTGILGKYSRSAWNDPMGRTSYLQQTKSVTLQGDDAYINGRHYKHDAKRDRDWPPMPFLGYASASA